MSNYHVPVMLKECLEGLHVRPGAVFVDCTMGGGGHFLEIAKQIEPDGVAIGVDRDADAIAEVTAKSEGFSSRVIIERTPFSGFPEVLKKHKISGIDGVLMDLGVSSHQFDEGARGFSYRADSHLDMRMDTRNNLTAEIIINEYSEESITEILRDYGEVQNPRRMAKLLVESRNSRSIRTTGELVTLLNEEYGFLKNGVLSKVFQGFRIAVNGELDELKSALESSVEWMNPGGRLVIMSYHSLEDRIVKQFIRDKTVDCICPPHFPQCRCDVKPTLKLITRKPVEAGADEVVRNVRARSAKLRIAERL